VQGCKPSYIFNSAAYFAYIFISFSDFFIYQ
jgi:hypothetical protein